MGEREPARGSGRAVAAEAVTDPDNLLSVQDGWNDAQGSENGDRCAWLNTQNITLASHAYAVQTLRSNDARRPGAPCDAKPRAEPAFARQNAAMTRERSVEIAPGVLMPLLGIGTWQARGRAVENAVGSALEIGYRLVDTAQMYGNEAKVGRAIAASGVPREEVFVTTKMWPDRAGHERATLEASLAALGLEQVDLWLIHWPPRGGARPDVWQRFLDAQDEGLSRAVGVSNYSIPMIDELGRATGRLPSVNQIEWGPALYDEETLLAHRERGVQLEGYSPLKATNLSDRRILRIAEADGVTPARVVIRWHIEHEIVVIPKSTHADRIAENFDVWGFELSDDEVQELDALGESARRD